MIVILGSHNFWQYWEIIFRRYLAITLKVSVRFTLKELRCELWSSFDIISDSEKGGILLLQIAVIFETKKKNESKRKHRVPEFFHKQEEKRPFIFRDNYQKLFIFMSDDIWQYLAIFNDIWRYMTTENCRPKISSNILIYRLVGNEL